MSLLGADIAARGRDSARKGQFASMAKEVVVRASISGLTIRTGEGDSRYRFKKGDLGVLSWLPHETVLGFWMPVVTWDDDEAAAARGVNFLSIEVVGIRINEAQIAA
jgi:hypothetical protein